MPGSTLPKKDYEKALLYIKSAVENDEDEHLLEHYGDILWFNNEKEQAVEQYSRRLIKIQTTKH